MSTFGLLSWRGHYLLSKITLGCACTFYVVFFSSSSFFNPHLSTCLLILERGRGRGRERGKHQGERVTLISCLWYLPQQGTEPKT